ncbi:MAG: aldehyde dehydrogenase, partial [Pandoraea sp.]|nr:aldehyde dehydrogenase [Pandoraea sp.]
MADPQAAALLGAFAKFFPKATTLGSFVNGELLEGTGDANIEIVNPATGQTVLSYRDAGAAVVAQAAHAAQA